MPTLPVPRLIGCLFIPFFKVIKSQLSCVIFAPQLIYFLFQARRLSGLSSPGVPVHTTDPGPHTTASSSTLVSSFLPLGLLSIWS